MPNVFTTAKMADPFAVETRIEFMGCPKPWPVTLVPEVFDIHLKMAVTKFHLLRTRLFQYFKTLSNTFYGGNYDPLIESFGLPNQPSSLLVPIF